MSGGTPLTLRLATLALAAGAFAVAHASEALATKHGCLNCHEVSKKLVGPSFKSVAEKYKGQAAAPEMLGKKLLNGSTGVWGPIPMPAMPGIPAEDARALVAWVLVQ